MYLASSTQSQQTQRFSTEEDVFGDIAEKSRCSISNISSRWCKAL